MSTSNAPVNTAIYAQGVCNWLARCSPAFVREHFKDEVTCVASYEEEATRLFVLAGVTATRTAVNACAVELDKASCDVDVEMIAACDFKGSSGEGTPCTTGAQCASGTCFHDAGETSACGTCSVRAGGGDSCTAAGCGPGLVCEKGTCNAKTAPPIGAASAGEACDAAKTCDSRQGLICENRTCVAPLAKLGEPCDTTPFCEGSFCKTVDRICRAHVAAGESCTTSAECAFPLVCAGGSRRCVLRAACGPTTQ